METKSGITKDVSKPRILVVEDDFDTQELLAMLLEGEGYEVIPAHNGTQAISRIKEDKNIHLVILDIMLPDISGIEVCRVIKSQYVNLFLPVLMLTAKSEPSDKIAGLDEGGDEYITKPFLNDVLLAKIQSLLRIKDLNTRITDLMDFQARVMDSIDSALISLNRDTTILSVNKKAQDLFELSDESIGQKIDIYLPGFRDNLVKDMIAYVCGKGLVYTIKSISYEWPRESGVKRYYDIRCLPLISERENRGAVLLLDDVTNQVIVQNKLIGSSKNTLLGDITMTLAHNLNNPLTSVYGRVQYLLSKLDADNSPKFILDNLNVIQEHLIKVLEIIKDVSAFAGKTKHAPKRIHMNDIIKKALALTEHELAHQGIEIDVEIDPSVPNMLLDENSMEQALINLILNAKDAMPEGGELKIKARKATSEIIEVSFCDTGCGISKEERSLVFDLFYTKKEANIGLGLTTVSRVVQEHGGTVKIESDPGKGTCVIMEFPMEEDPVPAEPKKTM